MIAETTTSQSLKHGEYKVTIKKIDSHNDIISEVVTVKPLNQEDLANGWLRVKPKKKDIIHHFSIYLSQLPSNLWKKVRRSFSKDKTSDYYIKIKHGNYHYSIKNSPNDEMIFELYRNIMSSTPNIKKIKDIYKELNNNRVKGWIMIKAENM
jgi:hypothetical protein